MFTRVEWYCYRCRQTGVMIGDLGSEKTFSLSQHSVKSPKCNNRYLALYRKCLNCEEYVNDDGPIHLHCAQCENTLTLLDICMRCGVNPRKNPKPSIYKRTRFCHKCQGEILSRKLF